MNNMDNNERHLYDIPQFKRGLVWCGKCGKVERVNVITCLSGRWPICCGSTMTIDSPEERGVPVEYQQKPSKRGRGGFIS